MRTAVLIFIAAALITVIQISLVSQSSFLITYTHVALLASTFAAIFLKPTTAAPLVILIGIFLDGVTALPIGTMTVSLTLSTLIASYALKSVIRNKHALVAIATILGPSLLTVSAWLFDRFFVWFGDTGTHIVMNQQLGKQLISITIGNSLLAAVILLMGHVITRFVANRFIRIPS